MGFKIAAILLLLCTPTLAAQVMNLKCPAIVAVKRGTTYHLDFFAENRLSLGRRIYQDGRYQPSYQLKPFNDGGTPSYLYRWEGQASDIPSQAVTFGCVELHGGQARAALGPKRNRELKGRRAARGAPRLSLPAPRGPARNPARSVSRGAR